MAGADRMVLTEQMAIRGQIPANLDLVLSGHLHDFISYEFGPERPAQLIVGTGGAPLYLFGGTTANSMAQMRAYGILKLTLRDTGFDSVFLPVNGAPYDAYLGTCH